jgi:hypothetical protein
VAPEQAPEMPADELLAGQLVDDTGEQGVARDWRDGWGDDDPRPPGPPGGGGPRRHG